MGSTTAKLTVRGIGQLPGHNRSNFALIRMLITVIILDVANLTTTRFTVATVHASCTRRRHSTTVTLNDSNVRHVHTRVTSRASTPSSCCASLLPNVNISSIGGTRTGLATIKTVASRFSSLRTATAPSTSADGCVRPIHAAANGSTGRAACAIGAIVRGYCQRDNAVSYEATSRLNVSKRTSVDNLSNAPSTSLQSDVLDRSGVPAGKFAFVTGACVPVMHIIMNIA